METEQQEDETLLLRHKLNTMLESKDGDQDIDSENKDDKKLIDDMKNQLNEVEEDIQLALMSEDEAREHLLGKIDSIQGFLASITDDGGRTGLPCSRAHTLMKNAFWLPFLRRLVCSRLDVIFLKT